MKRYSIMVKEYGGRGEYELCQVDSNPQAVIDGLLQKTKITVIGVRQKRVRDNRYEAMRIRENVIHN